MCVAVAVLEHFTWGGKGGARGHARVAWEGGQYVVFYTVYNLFIVNSCPNTSVLNAQEKQGVQTNNRVHFESPKLTSTILNERKLQHLF